MKRNQVVLAIALLVCVAIGSTANAQTKVPGGYDFELDVLAVENRSHCEQPEWYIQVTNETSSTYYRVRIVAQVYSSRNACQVNIDDTEDLAPGECDISWTPMPQTGECDLLCCDRSVPECNKCTNIRNAEVTLVGKSGDGVNWDTFSTPYLLFEIVDDVPSEPRDLIKTCDTGVPLFGCP